MISFQAGEAAARSEASVQAAREIAQREVEEAKAKKVESALKAQKIVPAEIARQEAILQAEAVAEKMIREAEAKAKGVTASSASDLATSLFASFRPTAAFFPASAFLISISEFSSAIRLSFSVFAFSILIFLSASALATCDSFEALATATWAIRSLSALAKMFRPPLR